MADKPVMEKAIITEYESGFFKGGIWRLALNGQSRSTLQFQAHGADGDYVPVSVNREEAEKAVAYLQAWLQETDPEADGEE